MIENACFFFFSSRRRHTRYWRDWSSDVCSSDLLERLARAAVVPVRRRVHAVRGLDPAGERAHPHRHRLEPAVVPDPQHRRDDRAPVLPAALRRRHDLPLDAVLPALGAVRRGLDERRRPADLARQGPHPARLHPARPAVVQRDREADRRHARRAARRPPEREPSRRRRGRGGTPTRRHRGRHQSRHPERRGGALAGPTRPRTPVPEPPMAELIAANLAPIMFAALVVFLLLGYPVAFALAANGLLFFVLAVELAPYA